MGGGVDTQQQMQTSISAPTMSGLLTPRSQRRYQQDLLERENQASALAAAGMVAESVSLTKPASGQVIMTQQQGLQPPPALVAGSAAPASWGMTTELDSINWNLMDMGAVHLDDMDLDFASLFDPANELSYMETKGSGWPTSTDAATTATTAETTASTSVNSEHGTAVSLTPEVTSSGQQDGKPAAVPNTGNSS
jgi:hypothetical protein